MSGKQRASQNLRSRLGKHMQEIDTDRRAEILGGKVALRRRRSKASRAGGDKELAKFIDQRCVLKGWKEGYDSRTAQTDVLSVSYGTRVLGQRNIVQARS